MKRLSEELKRMLNALALQDAAETLPRHSNLAALEMRGGSGDTNATAQHRRVALLSDGANIDAVLNYTLEACQRQQASLDLVLYGDAKTTAEKIRAKLERRGIAHELIMLGDECVNALAEYINARRSLVYLVASADDRLAKQLTDELLPNRSGRMHLPMVLIERKQRTRIHP